MTNFADDNLFFIVFSDDWGEHISSCQHIFNAISKQYSVLWVNTIGMRYPKINLSDLRKTYRKVSKMFGLNLSDTKVKSLNLSVCQPFMLPFFKNHIIQRFNLWSVRHSIHKVAKQKKIVNPIFIVTVPNACDYVCNLKNELVVYYCVDDFVEWPGLEKDLVRDMENRLIKRADILIATSSFLYKKLKSTGKPTFLLTHGVDIDLFSRQLSYEHPCFKGISKPRVGFFGLFDDRIDKNLIIEVASQMREVSFIITGPIETSVAEFNKINNIYFTGPVQYQQLPELIMGLDVLFIPYLVNDFSNSLSPLKLKEYLVTGKPVISTPIADLYDKVEYVLIATSVDDWIAALNLGLTMNASSRRQTMSAVMSNESWNKKAEMFIQICKDLTYK